MNEQIINKSPRLRFAIDFARNVAAPIMIKNFHKLPKLDSIEWKSDNSPVTVADNEINYQFINDVADNFPSHQVLGEESESRVSGAVRSWVIDPVDGTGPYSHGQATFVCAISELNENGEPELGVIFDPMADRLLYAEKGTGAFLNGTRISPGGSITSMDRTVIHLTSHGLMPLRQNLYTLGALPVLLNAIQYGCLLVCSGFAGGAVYALQNNWDGAAVDIIAKEAGMVMTDLDGNDQRYDKPINGFILANSQQIHKILIEEVRKAR